ncbi:MAG: hypothetical protein M1819_002127 [Sarea resinae]|nr:MAG: hypothetical protein M1819_002127 [Sarea resinae]
MTGIPEKLAGDGNVVENDVPMQGAGFYNSNSALQAAAMVEALPLLERSSRGERARSEGIFTAVEYGAAQGNNSLMPFKRILESHFKDISPEQQTQAQLIFSDRPANDFNSLATTVSSAKWPASLSVFSSMVPRSFYQPVMPHWTVNVGFSLAALHHLSHVPAAASVADASNLETRQAVLREQSRRDLRLFLDLRAAEFLPGSELVLSFVGTAASGAPNYAPVAESCRAALADMVKDGVLSTDVLGRFEVPTYNRTIEDVRGVLDELEDVWEVERLFEKEIEHPAIQLLRREQQRQKSSIQDAEIRDGGGGGAGGGEGQEKEEKDCSAASIHYATTVIDWMMAVISGYFIKAVRHHDPAAPEGRDGAEEEAQKAAERAAENESSLLEDWIARSKKIFLARYRDERIFCCVVYLKLIRKAMTKTTMTTG